MATDSAAARGMASRRGIGRVRHVSTRYLWLQERVARQEGRILKIPGERNRADALTKSVPAPRLLHLCGAMGLEFRGGRAKAQKGSLATAAPECG